MVCSVCVCHLLSSFGFAASVVLPSFFSSDLFAGALEDFFVGLYTNGAASALRATFGDDEFGTNAETFAESFLGGVASWQRSVTVFCSVLAYFCSSGWR